MEERSNELLSKVNKLLKEEGIDTSNFKMDTKSMLNDYLLPGMKNSKDTLVALKSFKVKERIGL